MRRISFAIALFGLFLLTLSLYQAPRSGDLKYFEINEAIKVSGVLSSVREGATLTRFKIGNYDAYCDCEVSIFSGKEVSVEGVVTEYNEKRSIKVTKII
jgi:hypothetical protein